MEIELQIILVSRDVKIDLRILMKKYEADPEKGIPKKSILKPFGVKSLIRQRMSKKWSFVKIKSKRFYLFKTRIKSHSSHEV